MDTQFYQTGQFARKARVSLRTLRYYDEVGLLSPSYYSKAGYRLYTHADLESLQYILALKLLGFSLEEIKQLSAGTRQLQNALAQQKAMLQEKRAQLDTIIQTIEKAEHLLQQGQYNWDALIDVIQVMNMEQEQKQGWVEKYFTPEQLQTMGELTDNAYTDDAKQRLKELHPGEWTEEDQRRCDEQYAFVKRELGRLVAIGADPASPEAQQVAQVKHELSTGFAKGDPLIEASVGKWWEGYYALPVEQRPFDDSTSRYTPEEQEFLKKALEIYHQHH